jgi:inner membrane protein
VPFPVAHGLIGASVVAALLPSSRSRIATPLLLGAFLSISPDFDFALNWLRVGRGGWHHGFTHSLPFALLIGIVMVILMREWKPRSLVVFTGAFASHTLLDYLLTESQGVALWWPFTDHRYKLRLPNPIDYTWDDASFWETTMDVLKIVAAELLIFVPVLLAVLLIRRVVVKRSRLKQPLGVSISVLVVMFLATTPAFSQDKQRTIDWAEPLDLSHATSSTYTIVPQIEVLEIVGFAVGGKSIKLGEAFTADDEWLKNLTVRIKNTSSTSITRVQLDLFLTEIMPGGPQVVLCYGCKDTGGGKSLAPGEEAEMQLVFYDWLVGQITSKSTLEKITRAEIQMMLVTLPEGKILYSRRVKMANKK